VEGLVVSLAAELAPQRIRVNGIAPSLTRESAMAQGMTSNEKMAQALAQLHPLGRLGMPMDSAQAAVFLLSPQASGWMTGQMLSVDGGRSRILS
jgi:NAD(P)-dependent dehydrogenase (short-subunit alcohol dehydrogenase family)